MAAAGTGRGPPDPAGPPYELKNVALTARGQRLWSDLVQEPGRVSSALPLSSQLAPGCHPGRTQRVQEALPASLSQWVRRARRQGTAGPLQGRGHHRIQALGASDPSRGTARPGHPGLRRLLRAQGLRPRGPPLSPRKGPGPHDLRLVRVSAGGSGGGGAGSAHPAVPQFPSDGGARHQPLLTCLRSRGSEPPGAFRAQDSGSGLGFRSAPGGGAPRTVHPAP